MWYTKIFEVSEEKSEVVLHQNLSRLFRLVQMKSDGVTFK